MEKSTIITDGGTMDDCLWSNLPPEIVIDVLYRLPVKSLCRFKCVSPSWKTLISSPHFAQTHHRRITGSDNPPYKAILFSSSKDIHTLDFADANPTPKKLNLPSSLFNHMDQGSKSLSFCNGLVLVSDDYYFNLLLNPSTCEYKELPAPFGDYYYDDILEQPVLFFYDDILEQPVLGYDSYADDYKVVLLVHMNGNPGYMYDVAVYSLKTDAWRMIQELPASPVKDCRGVCFNERIHWLCESTDVWMMTNYYGVRESLDYSRVVVAFSLADEIFTEVPLPALGDCHECSGHHMVVLGGCLSLLVWSEPERIDVWMMMNYGVRESWSKFSTTYPGWSIVDVLCLSTQDELVLGRKRLTDVRTILPFEFEGDKLSLYNPKEGTWRDAVVPGFPPKSLVGDHYIETLVSPNRG